MDLSALDDLPSEIVEAPSTSRFKPRARPVSFQSRRKDFRLSKVRRCGAHKADNAGCSQACQAQTCGPRPAFFAGSQLRSRHR